MSQLSFAIPKSEKEVERLGGDRLKLLSHHLGVKIKGLDYDEATEKVWKEIVAISKIAMSDDEDGSPTPAELGLKVGSRVRYHKDVKGVLHKIRCKVTKLNNNGSMDLEDREGNTYLGVLTTEIIKLVKVTDDDGNVKWRPVDSRPDRRGKPKKKKVVVSRDDDDDEDKVEVKPKKKKVVDDDDDDEPAPKKKVVVEDEDDEDTNPLEAVAKHILKCPVPELMDVLEELPEEAIDLFMQCKAAKLKSRKEQKRTSNGDTITGTMLKMLREASEDEPVTKDQLLEVLVEKFSHHSTVSLSSTVSKIPWTLENIAGKKTGVKVKSRSMGEGKKKGYWIDEVEEDDDD